MLDGVDGGATARAAIASIDAKASTPIAGFHGAGQTLFIDE